MLVGLHLPGVPEPELRSSLDELARLAKTLGLRPIARLTQPRPGTGAPTLLGEGKLRELAKLTGGSGVVSSGASRRQTGAKPVDSQWKRQRKSWRSSHGQGQIRTYEAARERGDDRAR